MEKKVADPDIEEIRKIRKIILPVLKRKGVMKAGIFGSYARGEAGEKSDIDLLVEPPKGIGFGFVGIKLELEDRLNRKVDLLSYRAIHPLLKERILNEEVRLI
ncbi:MAG: nucleotidyltransferase family protein [Candidatus Altiarchaeota archaeon]|nr:nucleotidyltransferase family protein [Candidatus Altiarchaeota archaeon]